MRVLGFLKYGKISLVFSSLCIVAGLVVTGIQGGFNLGLDFQPGLSEQVAIDPALVKAPIDRVRSVLQAIAGIQIQVAGEPQAQQYIFKVKQENSGESSSAFARAMSSRIFSALASEFGEKNIRVLQSESVGPRFSAGLASQAVLLTSIALVLIMLYCWLRFKLSYAVAAIAATLHDTLFMVAVIGAFRFEVSTATVAAILTIIGYSLNDTIVIFDRVRENAGLMREASFSLIINTSTTQSLRRTIFTSVTTLLAVLALYIFGSGDVQQFSLNMIIGVCVGTYSSLFIACPVLSSWRAASDRKSRRLDPARLHAAKAEAPVSPQALPAAAGEGSVSSEVSESEAASGEEDVQDGASSGEEKRFSRLSREARKRKFKK